MNGENKRSREAVRKSVRTYGVKVMDPASLPLKKTKERESQESVSRFSEKSLHSHYEIRQGFCVSLMHRIPYATLLAFILCLLGIIIFATGSQRGEVVSQTVVTEVIKQSASRVSNFDVVLFVFEILTAVLAVMILVVGILATGDTRAKVYGGWRARAGGRLCCVLLMALTIILLIMWLLMFFLCSMLLFLIISSKIECDLQSEKSDKKCLNLPMINIFLKNNRDVVLCDEEVVKRFCKDFVEKATPAFVMTLFGIFLIMLSLIMFLICLAANYARIRCQSKFQELEELHHLEGELHTSKDRF